MVDGADAEVRLELPYEAEIEKRSSIQETGMNYREFSSSRQGIRLRRADLHGYLLEGSVLDRVRCPRGQHRSGSLTVPAICRNIWHLLSPRRLQSAQGSADGPEAPPGNHGRHHDRALTLRHRRSPEQPDVAEPGEANPPAEEDTAEEEGPAKSEDAEAESRPGNPSRCPGGET